MRGLFGPVMGHTRETGPTGDDTFLGGHREDRGRMHGGPLSSSVERFSRSGVGNQVEPRKHLSDAPVTPPVSLQAVAAVTPVEPVPSPVRVPWTVRAVAPWLIGLAAVGAAAEALHLLAR